MHDDELSYVPQVIITTPLARRSGTCSRELNSDVRHRSILLFLPFVLCSSLFHTTPPCLDLNQTWTSSPRATRHSSNPHSKKVIQLDPLFFEVSIYHRLQNSHTTQPTLYPSHPTRELREITGDGYEVGSSPMKQKDYGMRPNLGVMRGGSMVLLSLWMRRM